MEALEESKEMSEQSMVEIDKRIDKIKQRKFFEKEYSKDVKKI